jgi:acyl-CoA thioesterase FadM
MSKIFTRRFRARFSEIGYNDWVEPAHYLRYLVETASDWGTANGLGIEDSHELGLAWVIAETQFEFYHPLRYDQSFDFTIWLVEWKRVRGVRNFEMRRHEDGKLLARGVQRVVSLNAETLRPVSPPPEFLERFTLEDPVSFPFEPFPKSLPDPAWRGSRLVTFGDLDVMQHVNNAVYMDYAAEALAGRLGEAGWPPDRLVAGGLALEYRRVHLKYRFPALWGEQLKIGLAPGAGEVDGCARVWVSMENEAGAACQAALDVRLVGSGDPVMDLDEILWAGLRP